MHVGPKPPAAGPPGRDRRRDQHQQPAWPTAWSWAAATPDRQKARRKLLEDLAQPDKDAATTWPTSSTAARCRRYTTLDRLQEVLKGTNTGQSPSFGPDGRPYGPNALPAEVAARSPSSSRRVSARASSTSCATASTPTPTRSASTATCCGEVADGVTTFFETLRQTGHDKRVRLMTFSEFGRRVQENASKGTDHGAASCLFVAGPGVKGGPVGDHPSLSDLDAGDLKYHTDFRQVYATLLDRWLGCDSQSRPRRQVRAPGGAQGLSACFRVAPTSPSASERFANRSLALAAGMHP